MNGPEPAVTPSGSRTARVIRECRMFIKRWRRHCRPIPHEAYHAPIRISSAVRNKKKLMSRR